MFGSLQDIVSINLVSSLKTGNFIVDTIITTLSISLFGYIYSKFETIDLYTCISYLNIYSLWTKTYTLTLSGETYSKPSYFVENSISNTFSNTVKAILHHITDNIDTNHSVREIKEILLDVKTYNTPEKTSYFISQRDRFIVDDKLSIYGYTTSDTHSKEDDKKETKVHTITLCLTSTVTNIYGIKKFLDDITKSYLEQVEETRIRKRFIYHIYTTKNDDGGSFDKWTEHEFQTTRSFQNMFFDRKEEIVSKLDFFLQNSEWYYEKGIPHTLGVGLHGPPGTGKTSLIKCIAKYTDRHIVCLSLKTIKTRKQLYEAFYETQYNHQNKSGSIIFDKKIIVIEDIDCLGEIVYKRDMARTKVKSSTNENQIQDVLETIANKNTNGNNDKKSLVSILKPDDPITLDDILNLWDGLLETPGRILIISSNHYDKLDPALTRPGRIDITLELSYVSRKTFSEIFTHLFGEKINASQLKRVPDKQYTPAEIMNMYISSNYNKDDFLSRVCSRPKII